MLDIACGSGRHMQWFALRGLQTTGIDRNPQALAAASQYGTVIDADIENAPWPLLTCGQPMQFDVVVVTNYLWRALFSVILQSLAPGGLLLYETFTSGNASVGKPSNPDFLLHPGELLQVCQNLHIVAYENGFLDTPERFVQRIAAVNPAHTLPATTQPLRYPLSLK